jgi:hypothetical protein
MPPGAVADHHGMRAWLDLRADLLQMLVHRFGVGSRHDNGGGHSAGRADRAEQIDRVVAIIPHRGGP